MNEPCHRLCLTPTRNEAWIIQQFLAAATDWATQVIVADQGSTDGTAETARATPKVRLIVNDAEGYDESYRQRLLLKAARENNGKRILLALDADEALSANWKTSAEWKQICDAAPGTVLRFRWVNVLPGFQQAWVPPALIACGFVDDGTEHGGGRIHNRRVPFPDNAPTLDLQEIVVLHFQFVAWERMTSKHRWYQVWEHLHHPHKGPLDLFRQYHHMYGSWDDSELCAVQNEWVNGFDQAPTDFQSLKPEAITWWDREIVQMLRQHGRERFRRLAIWDKDWQAVAHAAGMNGADFSDPRSNFEKTAHRLLARTQRSRARWSVRGLERLLRARGW